MCGCEFQRNLLENGAFAARFLHSDAQPAEGIAFEDDTPFRILAKAEEEWLILNEELEEEMARQAAQ